ncbi:WYL domain-containing protein [Brevibacillus fulvus]|uniref:DNA-binding transcriptional regulator YafY n=1 Tax=Brevibacillus fulvus TaxID=1125967 RepID=A0A939BSQ1_9BACL|nr:WYL domain-containing protein [Brevibacillus fulvus]MBM7590703.1 putative DNA-binding transcriptional regulator YafY [Brevibacillus fulvus]
MLRQLQRYLMENRPVEVIYLDRQGQTSKRRLRLHSVDKGYVKAYCYSRRAYRLFALDRILAIAPVSRHA